MRWILSDPNIPEERAYKEHVLAATERWWQAFAQQAVTIDRMFHRQADFDLPRFMNDTLSAIHPRLMWEFGPPRKGNGHRLCITPESAHGLRPLLKHVLSRAPQLPGWEFYGHRLPEPVENALATVEGRVGIKVQGTTVAAQAAQGYKVDVFFSFPRLKASEEQLQNAAFVLAEALFGEETLDSWIGAIGLAHEAPKLRYMPLERSQETISAVLRSFYEQLPQQAEFLTNETTRVVRYELNPEHADDYPRRQDLLVGSHVRPNVIDAILRHRLFNSRCHTRFPERFCYLKIDAGDVPQENRVEFRAQLEEPLWDALRAANVGGAIGGGSGLAYSYIDLALTDVVQALPVIRQVLSSRGAPFRSWLLFDDSEFEYEWAGIYPQTPPPPMAPEQ